MLTLCLPIGLGCMRASADELKIGTGVDCSSGKYGQETPTVVCFYPHNIHAFTGPYEFKLSFPYVDIKDASGTNGYGDVSFYAGKTIAEDVFGLDAIDLGVKVKGHNGRADRGLGTGRMAYAGGVALTSLVDSRHIYLVYYGLTSGSRQDSRIGSYATIWYKYMAGRKLRFGLIYENNEIGYINRIETLTLMPEIDIGSGVVIKPFIYVGLNAFAPSKGAGLVTSYSFQ